mmetsp:Transcript_25335/g.59308  ORF Transcript_25335/g.59308 Transcript_25335/m.59308 type:complete len:187 (-) Transcript_25335:126-686(-)
MQPFNYVSFLLISSCALGTISADIGVDSIDCYGDVKILKVDGLAPILPSLPEEQAVPIQRHDGSSVTLELRQEWFPTVDSIYYEFEEHSGTRSSNPRICRHATTLERGDLYDTISVACNSRLEFCMSDGNELPAGMTSTHCRPELPGIHAEPEPEPTICYSLEVRCESLCGENTARNRRLRGSTAK